MNFLSFVVVVPIGLSKPSDISLKNFESIFFYVKILFIRVEVVGFSDDYAFEALHLMVVLSLIYTRCSANVGHLSSKTDNENELYL